MSSAHYTVEVNHEDGSFWARVLELPGCFATGRDLDELQEALGEAISLYLSDDPEAGEIRSMVDPIEVEQMRVKVPA